jgi:dihydrofolate synthase/folylpolyglutamate synthase
MDATTAVPADMALMTPIALDHQAWLGDTLAAIADEKAYAMQGCHWAISVPQADDVAEILQRHRADIEFVSGEEDFTPLKMAGDYQRCNALLACAAIRRLCVEGEVAADLPLMMEAVADTEVPGRLQHIRWHHRHIWLDAAHNMHAVRALLPSLHTLANPFDGILVFTREDRDLADALPLLRPFTRRLVAQHDPAGCCDAKYNSLQNALDAEIAGKENGSFLVLGSFTSVAASESWLMENRESE